MRINFAERWETLKAQYAFHDVLLVAQRCFGYQSAFCCGSRSQRKLVTIHACEMQLSQRPEQKHKQSI